MRSVHPSVYTTAYYLSDCTGYQEFLQSGGKDLNDRFRILLSVLPFSPRKKVLDIGSGRGEMCVYAAQQGCTVIGVDYSRDAITLARKMLRTQPKHIQKRVQFIQSFITSLHFPSKSFDIIYSIETFEHLYPEELEILLSGVRKWLKDDGVFIVHTAPNRWFNDIGYPLYCHPMSKCLVHLWNSIFRTHYPHNAHPTKLRTESHHTMHVNEPTYFSLQSLFKKHRFSFTITSTNVTIQKPVLSWKDSLFNTLVYLMPLSKFLPFNIVFGNDFLVSAKKK